MAYTKQNWIQKMGTSLNRFLFSQDATHITLTNDPEEITTEGTPITSGRLNHIEDGVYEASLEADRAIKKDESGSIEGNLSVSGDLTSSTLSTGQGANKLYEMDQNVKKTDSVKFASVDTGHGANELYGMNQDVKTNSDVKFNTVDATSITGTVYAS